MVHQTADCYLTAFRARAACCRALLELTSQQRQLLENHEYAALLQLLAEKQRLLEEITTTGPGGPDLWQKWREIRNELPESSRQICEQSLDEAEELLRELLQLEKASTGELESRREDTQRALADVNQGGTAALGYQSPVESVVSRRLDFDL